jgi:hypothetical protein
MDSYHTDYPYLCVSTIYIPHKFLDPSWLAKACLRESCALAQPCGVVQSRRSPSLKSVRSLCQSCVGVSLAKLPLEQGLRTGRCIIADRRIHGSEWARGQGIGDRGSGIGDRGSGIGDRGWGRARQKRGYTDRRTTDWQV